MAHVPVGLPCAKSAGSPNDPLCPLARLFTLRARAGVLRPQHLEPLRRALAANRLFFDRFRAAADEATSPNPCTSMEALRLDVILYGPALDALIETAVAELEILAGALEEEAADAS